MDITADIYQDVNHCIRCGHKLELVTDNEQKLRPKCPSCGWVYYKNPVPAAACVILNQQNQLVLIKRGVEPKKGSWALPSGYIEINQTPAECAVQEMAEETSLTGEVVTFLDYYTGFSPIYLRVLSFGFLLRVTGGTLQAGDDAQDAMWVPIDQLPTVAFASHRHFISLVNKMIDEGTLPR